MYPVYNIALKRGDFEVELSGAPQFPVSIPAEAAFNVAIDADEVVVSVMPNSIVVEVDIIGQAGEFDPSSLEEQINGIETDIGDPDFDYATYYQSLLV